MREFTFRQGPLRSTRITHFLDYLPGCMTCTTDTNCWHARKVFFVKFQLALPIFLLALLPSFAHGEIVITEVMYNSSGAEADTEWVEIYNSGSGSVDLTGWFLDDEDANGFGPENPLNGSLMAGQVGIIFNDVLSASDFADGWELDSSVALFAVTWGSLANGPSDTNEIITLHDSSGTQVDIVNYDDENGWPADNNSASIYLLNPELDNNVGTNWALSQLGVDGGRAPIGGAFSTGDVGSPGFVVTAVPEPSTFAVCLLGLSGAIGSRWRRRIATDAQ